jgi:hypothetical protein
MRNHRVVTGIAVVALCAQSVAAQDWTAPPCASGPGASFGVTAYQCASCTFKFEPQDVTTGRLHFRMGQDTASRVYTVARQRRATFGFNTEPVVLETAASSVLRPGDVIEAVNDLPITTRAGSDLFTYPATGTYTIRVRRGGNRIEVTSQVTTSCGPVFRWDYAIPPGRRGRSGGDAPANPPEVIDALRTNRTGLAPAPSNTGAMDRRFGFAVGCLPSCTRSRARNGSEYYKFDGFPPVVDLIDGGVAHSAGIRKGDQIVEIDGLSILDEEGALRFLQSTRSKSLELTVLRNGERIRYSLRVR